MKFKEAIKKAREASKERKFDQTLELIINLKSIDTKSYSLNDTIKLPEGRGKDFVICVVGTGDFVIKGRKCSEKTIDKNEFSDYKDKKKVKKFVSDVDYFVVEATVMADFAKTFGQVLGPIGKMPLPHHIVPPGGDPCPRATDLRKTVRVKAKKTAVVQVPVGTEKMSDEDLEKNLKAVYEFILHKQEHGKENIRNLIIKFTMGKGVKVNG
ncbi:MAG: 50S ribosomal protein L1 [Candidatus Altiarchaeota archaeon]|nr:50S ribosomal protein L1 [Candidatus Altiarchaeota archaeon]